MSYLDLRDDLDIWEYTVLLSEAMDAEDMQEYAQAAMASLAYHEPKKLRKFRGAYKKASKLPPRRGVGATTDALVGFARQFTGGEFKPSGSAAEWAAATGRTIVYLHPDGRLTDINGHPLADKPEGALVLGKAN